jgi:hypothetical protein
MKRQVSATRAAPTPGPWRIDDDEIVYCHWRYTGWPHFGRITVAHLDPSWPQGRERRANLELIATAANACFAIAPESPIAAARAFPALVDVVTGFLEQGEPAAASIAASKRCLRVTLARVKGGGP